MMFWKEGREAIRTVPIATIVIAIVTYNNVPGRTTYVYAVANDYASAMALWGAMYALVLALLQTWTEQRTDVRGWLLSHPFDRSRIFWGKTFAALSVYFSAFILPWSIAIFWLARVTPETRPADPLMLVPGLLTYLAAFSFHPAVIWMMSRQARWVGSKTIVLALPLLVTVWSTTAFQAFLSPISWTIILIFVAFCVWAFATIAKDAYARQSNHPTGVMSSTLGSWTSFFGILAAVSTVGFVALLVLYTAVFPLVSPTGDGTHEGHRFTADGELVATRERYLWDVELGQSKYRAVEARRLPSITTDETFASDLATRRVPDEQLGELKLPSWLQSFSLPSHQVPFQQIEPFQYSDHHGGLTWVYHDDGYYLAYSDTNSVTADQNLLAMTLDRSGFGSTEAPFANPQPISRFRSSLGAKWQMIPSEKFGLVDRNGVYQASIKDQTIETVLDMQIDEIILMPKLANAGPTAVVMRGNRIHLFDIESGDPDHELPRTLTEKEETAEVAFQPWPGIRMTERQVIDLPERWYPLQDDPPISIWAGHSAFDLGDAGFQLTQFRHGYSAKTLRFNKDGQLTESLDYRLLKAEPVSSTDLAIRAIFPPAVNVASAAFSLSHTFSNRRPVSNFGTMVAIIAVGALLHGIVAWLLTKMTCGRRCLTSKSTTCWCLMSILTGLITPIMVLCAYPQIATEACSGCSKRIRIDVEKCPHCAAAWQPPQRSGIEVFANT